MNFEWKASKGASRSVTLTIDGERPVDFAFVMRETLADGSTRLFASYALSAGADRYFEVHELDEAKAWVEAMIMLDMS